MQSNRIVVMLAADGISGLDISYGKNINTMYLNSHLNSEFVVRPAFLLGAAETMWVTFTKGETSTRPLLLAQRQTNDGNNSRQVVDGTESTIEKIPDTGYEYFIDTPDVVLQNVGEWKFSITITELPVDVEYKGQVNATSDLPSSGNSVGDTYWVGGSTNSYYYWNGSAWAVLNIVAVSTSDVGTITVNMSVGGQIGGYATDLDIQVLYNFVLRVLNRLSDYLPKIVDGYWWVWNSDSKAYVNSGEVGAIPSDYVKPSGTLQITDNGTKDVTNYKNVNVNVAPNLEQKTVTITENGTTEVTPTAGKDGMSKVTVTTNVPTASAVEEVATASAMDALLVEANVGKYYKFTGTTDSNYTNGDIYLVEGGVSSGETWVLNENAYDVINNFTYTANFVCDGTNYTTIVNSNNPMTGGLFYDTTQVVHPDYASQFVNEKYRTITFATAPTGDLLTWLQANGTKQ